MARRSTSRVAAPERQATAGGGGAGRASPPRRGSLRSFFRSLLCCCGPLDHDPPEDDEKRAMLAEMRAGTDPRRRSAAAAAADDSDSDSDHSELSTTMEQELACFRQTALTLGNLVRLGGAGRRDPVCPPSPASSPPAYRDERPPAYTSCDGHSTHTVASEYDYSDPDVDELGEALCRQVSSSSVVESYSFRSVTRRVGSPSSLGSQRLRVAIGGGGDGMGYSGRWE